MHVGTVSRPRSAYNIQDEYLGENKVLLEGLEEGEIEELVQRNGWGSGLRTYECGVLLCWVMRGSIG